jgi:hypothetical protein
VLVPCREIGIGFAPSNPRALSPNYALQRSWTHKLHGARTPHKSRTRFAACAVTGRRAAAELRRYASLRQHGGQGQEANIGRPRES